VEVYSYEDLTFAIDTYSVRQGDSLAAILRSRGLMPERGDPQREAQLLRLVGELNPVIANLDQISPGQTLYLPAPGQVEPTPLALRPGDDQGFADVVTYELGQPDQAPARVVVRRPSPTEEELGEGEYRLTVGGPAPLRTPFQASLENSAQDPAPTPPASASSSGAPPEPAPAKAPARTQAPPQGNDGPVGVAEDGTVYRTVKVRKGDTLEKLLRREGLDRDLIYRHLLKLTVGLNPGLKNPNVIVVGAELRIPTSGDYLASLGGGSKAAAVAAPSARPQASAQSAADKTQAAAHPPSAGDKYLTPTKRLPAAAMPSADSLSARNVLGIVFTRLGEKITAKGRLFLPLDEPPHFDVDTAKLPVLELNNGRKIVLDLSSSLPAELVKRFTSRYQEYQVFQPDKREQFGKAFEKLLSLCGYYRIYDKSQAFEGGRDVRLKISSDWLVWPNADSWNRGQPTVVNLAPAADNGTPQAWISFLSDHGIQVIDLFQGQLVVPGGKSPTPVNNFTVIEVDDNPSSFAAALIRSLGYSPRFGVRVEATRGRVITGGADSAAVNPPVFWETESGRNILEYGDLSQEDLEILRKNDFNVISSGKDIPAILKTILSSLKIELGQGLVLNGDSSGGPSITLTIAGQSFKFNGRSYLFTPVGLPDNMTSLDPNQNVVVLRYRPGQSQASAPVSTTVITSGGAPGGAARPAEAPAQVIVSSPAPPQPSQAFDEAAPPPAGGGITEEDIQ
jgi:LysM repeat protein